MADDPQKVTFSRTEALIPLSKDAQVISRADVEKVAGIIGAQSAAADALRRAAEHDGPVRFWYSAKQGMLTVELMKEKGH